LPVCLFQTKFPEDDVCRLFPIDHEQEPVEHESRKGIRWVLLWLAVGLYQEEHINQLVRQPGEQDYRKTAGVRRIIIFKALTDGL